ncbi:hypothetical protein D3C86_2243510 [compost metagenome]
MFPGFIQRGAGVFQQFSFGAALLVGGIHHHPRRRAAQIDTGLQHQIPGGGKFTLLKA